MTPPMNPNDTTPEDGELTIEEALMRFKRYPFGNKEAPHMTGADLKIWLSAYMERDRQQLVERLNAVEADKVSYLPVGSHKYTRNWPIITEPCYIILKHNIATLQKAEAQLTTTENKEAA